MEMQESRLNKVRALSDRFQVTPRTVYTWIADGRLEAVRIAGRIRVPEESVQRFIRPARDRKAG